jgi:NAD(P)-dependent dehydrogenase (short-subunit alcohol dehydrogenase family)
MTDPMFDLTGKVALVTGRSRGLGRAMAEVFAERGADVIVASRKADACESAAREITARFGVTALSAACNVSSWNECDALIDRAYTEFGRVDVLVNNAGMSPLYPSLDQVSEALWDKVVAVNLKGFEGLGPGGVHRACPNRHRARTSGRAT